MYGCILPQFIYPKRGIKTKSDIFDFFFQDIYSLSSPFGIKDMNIFVDRLKEAIESEEKILCMDRFDPLYQSKRGVYVAKTAVRRKSANHSG